MLASTWRNCVRVVFRCGNVLGGSAGVGRTLKAWGIALLLLGGSCAQANAWWQDEWTLRKKITIDTSSSGANITDSLGTAPVLIRLHIGNFRFASAKPDGSDLRFVAADDKTPLKYHIEKYDSLLAEALVWVSVPDLKPGAKSDIWLYYGNPKAVSGADAKGTYDPDTLLVYHFAERGTPPQDSSVWANGAQAAGIPAEGAIIGQGLHLDGVSSIALPASPSLVSVDNGSMTWSAWVKVGAPQPGAHIYSRRDGANAFVIGVDNGVPFVEVGTSAGTQRSTTGAAMAAGWHHIAVTAASGQVALYLDGAPYATLAAALPALNSSSVLGALASPPAPAPPAPAAVPPAPAAVATPPSTENGSAASAPSAAPAPADATAGAASTTATEPSSGTPTPAGSVDGGGAAPVVAPSTALSAFVGDIDELQIAKVGRTPGLIKLAAVNQGPDQGKLIVFAVDEEASSWFSGYFAVILKSVTLDGWVVIGILVTMAVVSWIVMIEKRGYVSRQISANEAFLKSFRAAAEDLTILDRGDADEVSQLGGRISPSDMKMMQNSSLYRIYHVGAAEIRNRFRNGGGDKATTLSAQSIAAIRATLDSTMVRELQLLNRSMVILTIAISGGPFLGLLGTVVGVMITFAAIAASGDVNVNAIAPGIAAALVATVAGLGVAIPALFGYNYLLTRIKNATTDMQVFVDEFITRMAEVYEGRPANGHRVNHQAAAE